MNVKRVAFALALVAIGAHADNSTLDAAIGGGLGGAAGAAIGNEVGGRNGAIVGGALGGAVGTARRLPGKQKPAQSAAGWH